MAALPLFIYIERRTIYPARVYTYLRRPVESASPSSLSWTGPAFSHLLFPPPPKEGIRKKGNISSPPRLPTSAFLLPRVRLTFPHPYIYSLDSGPRRAPHHLFIYRQHQRGKKRKKKKGLLLVYIPPSLFGVSSYRHQHFPYTLQHRYYSSTDRGSLEIDSTNGSDPLCNIKRFYFQTTAGMVVISSCATLGSNGELILIPSAAGPTFRKKRRQLTWA